MRDHRLGGHATVNWPLRRGSNHYGAFTGPAGVTRTTHDAHPQLRRHDVELLAAHFVDHMQRPAAAGAVALFDVDQHLVTRQMCREGTVVAVGTSLRPRPRL